MSNQYMTEHLRDAQQEDYEFLRSVGVTHTDACARIGVNPKVFRRRELRRG